MAARFKSRVMSREEKAFGSVDMNRMMTAGMGTGFVYALLRLMQVGILMIPGVFIAFFFFVWLTGKPGGVPRYMLFFYGWQAKLLIAARRSPKSMSGRLATLMGRNPNDIILNGDVIYTSATSEILDNSLSGFEIVDSDDINAGGFEIVTDDELYITIEG
ncbi:MAG: hypothetical protein AAFU54_18895 [Chloroflexota bacterium]